jgi:hypothetical protein
LAATSDPVQLYYVNLFLGSALESLDQRDEARAAYMRAGRYFDKADAPQLALSQLAVRSGHAEDAHPLLEAPLRRQGGSDQDDPWFTYPSDIRRRVEPLLTAAYGALSNPRPPEP